MARATGGYAAVAVSITKLKRLLPEPCCFISQPLKFQARKSDIHGRKFGKIVLVILEAGILAYGLSLGLLLPHGRAETLNLPVVMDQPDSGEHRRLKTFIYMRYLPRRFRYSGGRIC